MDRADAGRQLARQLVKYRGERPIILGLPRGGIPVAKEVSDALDAPLDAWVVRKVGAPAFPELGVGAVAEGGIVYLNRETIREVGATDEEIDRIVRRKQWEVAERVRRFRPGGEPLELEGRTVILVDDGIATGGTVRAAVQALRVAAPKKVVLAVPVAATQSLSDLRPLVDEVVCVHPTPALYAIGAWYRDFTQVEDEEVVRILEEAHQPIARAAAEQVRRTERRAGPEEVELPLSGGRLFGTLSGPARPSGLVLFAHGSGSSRFSPRNRHVASVLHKYGVATLLFDLLTEDEEAIDEETGELRFDIELLAERLVIATDWTRGAERVRGLPIGYFGSSTGAAAALVAAAERPAQVHAVVSRGGRPDLAWGSLGQVRAPTLLIVGGEDYGVIELNERAYARLRCEKRMEIVKGATHLFEEPGALDEVARLAGEWFREQLGKAKAATMEPLQPTE